MIERFQGESGKRRLIEALRSQELLQGNTAVAAHFADVVTVTEYQPGDHLLEQDSSDNHICFICSGKVSVCVNRREIATRLAGQHVGEMALVDPSAPRAATLIAKERTIVACLSEEDFVATADSAPWMWRSLAKVLAARLRQRNDLVRQSNEVAKLFIGCSTEALSAAREIQSGVSHDPILTTVWTDSVFQASHFIVEDLQARVEDADFAALLLSPDDWVTSRAVEYWAPRDNVVFELGLFMGVLGRDRTYLILPRKTEVKLPSDLWGITPLTYSPGDTITLATRMAPVCNELRKLILRKGPR